MASGLRILLRLGLVVLWLASAYVALMLLLWLMSPPGIGEGDWPQLWISLAVTIGLPVIVIVRWFRAAGEGRPPDGSG